MAVRPCCVRPDVVLGGLQQPRAAAGRGHVSPLDREIVSFSDKMASLCGGVKRYLSSAAGDRGDDGARIIDRPPPSSPAAFPEPPLPQRSQLRVGVPLRLLSESQRTLLDERNSFVRRVRSMADRMPGVEIPPDFGAGGGALLELLQSSTSDGGECRDSEANEECVIDSTFLVVIAGEFNAGKSTLINALLGQRLLESGALPTTDEVTVLAGDRRRGAEIENDGEGVTTGTGPNDEVQIIRRSGLSMHLLPPSLSPLLSDLTLVDTPGTNSVLMDHTSRTLRLLPSADLLLFVTSADRPLPDSERELLKAIRGYRKNVAVVLNKMDTLESSGGEYGGKEKMKMEEFVCDAASEALGMSPVVLPISARDALAAKVTASLDGPYRPSIASSSSTASWYQSSPLFERSNFSALEAYLRSTLTSSQRLRSKLLSPVGVAEGVLDACKASLHERAKELETDVATHNLLEGQMAGWVADTDRLVQEWREEVGVLLREEGSRSEKLLENMSYLDMWRWAVLDSSGEAFSTQWEMAGPPLSQSPMSPSSSSKFSVVTSPLEQHLLVLVRSLSSSLMSRASNQSRAVVEYLGRRPAIRSSEVVGTVGAFSDFSEWGEEVRSRLEGVVRIVLGNTDVDSGTVARGGRYSDVKNGADVAEMDEAMELPRGFSSVAARRDDSDRALAHVRSTAVLSGFLTLFSIGLGSSCFLLPDLIDLYVTIPTSASVLALSLALVPYRHSRLVSSLSSEWDIRREALDKSLAYMINRELKSAKRDINCGVEPYARYVRSERDATRALGEECEGLMSEGHALRGRINRINTN